MQADDFLTAPAVVVGGGIAGLSAALHLDGCTLACAEPIGGGSSCRAQGGIAAALAADDCPGLHATDTAAVAAELADTAIARLVATAAPGRVAWLASLGVAFDREPGGEWRLGREAAHSRDRIVHAGGDRTGAAVMRAMREAVHARPDIRLLEGMSLVDLVIAGDRTAGVLLEDAAGLRLAVIAPRVVLATGGIGACFDRTTNPASSRGAGLAAAARAGVRLADLEFVQFHPTALAAEADPLPLLTEALRGAGARLLDGRGRRFMAGAHPDAELAPRDVVAAAVHALRTAGEEVFLDATAVAHLESRFPGACDTAREAGFDPRSRPLPVATAAHFHMGGLATNAAGATSLPGLWACGEAAATGLHGGNRLASNSLVEGLVFGERVARAMRAAPAPAPDGPLEVPARVPLGGEDEGRVAVLRALIGSALGPLRSGPQMLAALRRSQRWEPASRAEEDLVIVASELLHAALTRRESRGAHRRADHPRPAVHASRSFQQPQPWRRSDLAFRRRRVA